MGIKFFLIPLSGVLHHFSDSHVIAQLAKMVPLIVCFGVIGAERLLANEARPVLGYVILRVDTGVIEGVVVRVVVKVASIVDDSQVARSIRVNLLIK